MKTSRIILGGSTLFLLAALSAGASATTTDHTAAVLRGSADGHAFQSGGYGRGEVVALARTSGRYNLRMTFSEGRHDAFTGPTMLRIENAAGKRVFALDEAGPVTDVALPAGHYRVTATFGGVARSSNVDLKTGAPATVNLHWPHDEA